MENMIKNNKQKVINFTNREKISPNHVNVHLVENEENKMMININSINLRKYDFPDEAKVIFEIFQRKNMTSDRIEVGTVGKLMKSSKVDRLFESDVFSLNDIVSARLKIIHFTTDNNGIILPFSYGVSENIKLEHPNDEEVTGSLLPIKLEDNLEKVTHYIDFTNGPLLVVSSKHKKLIQDKMFFALVVPELFKDVLYQYIEDDNDSWKGDWEEMILHFAGKPFNPDVDTKTEWIQNAKNNFSQEINVKGSLVSFIEEAA